MEGWKGFWAVGKTCHSQQASFTESIRSHRSVLPPADLFRQRLAGLHKSRMNSRKPRAPVNL